jgi:hypothetical protein
MKRPNKHNPDRYSIHRKEAMLFPGAYFAINPSSQLHFQRNAMPFANENSSQSHE